MADIDDNLDPNRFFIKPDGKKDYVQKGNDSHREKAYRLLFQMGLDTVFYSRYDDRINPAFFLVALGFIYVDEADEIEEETVDIFDDTEPANVKTRTVCFYCKSAISTDLFEQIKAKYDNEDNEFGNLEERRTLKNLISLIQGDEDIRRIFNARMQPDGRDGEAR